MRTKEELEYLIVKKNLAPAESLTERELTEAEIRRMPEPVYEFHMKYNGPNVEAALNASKIQAKNAREAENAKAKRIHAEQHTQAEFLEGAKVVERFLVAYPQFDRTSQSNLEELSVRMRQGNLLYTFENVVSVFEMMVREGKAVLNPSAVGIVKVAYSNGQTFDIRREDLPIHQRRNKGLTVLEPETAVTGYRLTKHPLLDILLSPYGPEIQAQREQAAVSADAYRQQHPEAFRNPTAEAQRVERERKDAETFLSFHPECSNVLANWDILRAELKQKNLPTNRNSFEAVYPALVEADRLAMNSNAVVASGMTRMIDCGANQGPLRANQTPEGIKPSLARRIANMTAREYEEFLRDGGAKYIDAAMAH